MQILDKFCWKKPEITLWTEIVQIKADIFSFYSFNSCLKYIWNIDKCSICYLQCNIFRTNIDIFLLFIVFIENIFSLHSSIWDIFDIETIVVDINNFTIISINSEVSKILTS